MFDPILDYNDSDREFEAYYRIVQTKVVHSYYWYKKHKNEQRIIFRTAGAIAILFSIIIPAISAHSFHGKDIVISIMALTIAAFSYFNTFFKWEEAWKNFSRSELAIEHLIGIWQLKLTDAKSYENETDRLSEASKATKYLLEEVGKIVSQETENYFSQVEWPKKQG